MEEQKWWTPRECQAFLGISKQKWGRIRTEYNVPSETTGAGIERFSSESVVDIGERLGLPATDDPNGTAIQVLGDTIEQMGEYHRKAVSSMSDYVKLLQGMAIEALSMLRSENDSLRTMRAQEQAAHLASLVATQEALDATAERQQLLKQAEGNELRKALALEFLMEKVAPRILEQWKTSGNLGKLVGLVRALDAEQVAAIKTLVTPEQAQAIDDLRAPPVESQKAEADARAL